MRQIANWEAYLKKGWQHSILLRLSLALVALVLPALLALFLSWSLAIKSTGGGVAINMAGSLRKQAYQIAAISLAPESSSATTELSLAASIAEFEARLHHPSLQNALTADPMHPVRVSFNKIEVAWRSEILPLLTTVDTHAASAVNILPAMHHFVGQIDAFVQTMETEHERKLSQLASLQWISLIIMALVLAALYSWFYRRIIAPLTEMAQVARQVEARDFAVRVIERGEGEIGELADAMNRMIAEIAGSYAVLEARVAEKTQELARNQRTLTLLYRVKQTLADSPPSEATFVKVLLELKQLVPFVQASVCLADENNNDAHHALKIAADGNDASKHRCLARDCNTCLSARQNPTAISGVERIITLREGGRDYGVMPVILPSEGALEQWQMDLLENVARHIATTLAQVRRKQEQHRLALLEERSVIARELHDSLAQSLSYLKIQVLRLQAQLPDANEGITAVVSELREGLNAAYRQLRELLTTFRLKMTERGLSDALDETISEFSGRLGFTITLDNRLLGVELAAQEEIHVLQIVREALVNIERHAAANTAHVALEWRAPEVIVTISDNGCGLPDSPEQLNHYGLQIMHDRAHNLGGVIHFSANAPSGTCITLRFKPTTPFV